MKMTCVIGGSGFLGSHVADELLNAGYKVRIFDRAHSKWIKSSQDMIIGDITNIKEVESAISNCDYVFNFAGLSDLNEALNKPIETIRLNILGNANILEACRNKGVKRYFYASSVYVHSREGSFYRCSKQSAESYVEEYQRSFGLGYTILRYGSLYGPRSDSSNGLYRVVKNAIQNQVISYSGSKDSLREYIHVQDAARATVVLMADEFLNENITITGQESMRIYDVLSMLSEIMGLKVPLSFIESDQVGHYIRTPYSYQPKVGRKYSPSLHFDLGQGLVQLIEEIQASEKTHK
jgi:UDP-glucose 4-epimerase